jgi:small subunit ribosomal protein S20
MPIIASAKKKLRQDRVRTKQNRATREEVKAAVKKARTATSNKTVQAAFSALDMAVKKGVVHKNKAARLKSKLAKQLKTQSSKLPAKRDLDSPDQTIHSANSES